MDLTDLDYKDLFRDAVNMMAHIARAAGFDPNDPTVEPPAIVARVESLRAEVERLTAERAAFLAPVEGVNLDEVLRLDREGTPAERWIFDTIERREKDRYVREIVVNQYEEVTKEYAFDDFPARSAELEAALAPIRTDEALIVLYRTAAPTLAREVIQLRAAVRFADEQGAEAIDRVSRAIVADKWNSTAKLQGEVKRLTAELEEARLTLAAEQGRAEGAPSEGWEFGYGWKDGNPTYLAWRKGRNEIRPCWEYDEPACWIVNGEPADTTARAAMLAADTSK